MTRRTEDDVTATRDTDTAAGVAVPVVSLDSAAAIVGCSRRTLQRAISRGELSRIEVEGRAVIERAALDAWAATRDTRHVAGMTSQRQTPRDTTRPVAPVSQHDASPRLALLEAEVAALQARAAYAERVAADRQRTIDTLAAALSGLTASLEAGAIPAGLAGGPIEHAPPSATPPAANTPSGPVTHFEAPPRGDTPLRDAVDFETPSGRRPWWRFRR